MKKEKIKKISKKDLKKIKGGGKKYKYQITNNNPPKG